MQVNTAQKTPRTEPKAAGASSGRRCRGRCGVGSRFCRARQKCPGINKSLLNETFRVLYVTAKGSERCQRWSETTWLSGQSHGTGVTSRCPGHSLGHQSHVCSMSHLVLSMSVSSGCRMDSPEVGVLKTTEMYFSQVQRLSSPRSRSWQMWYLVGCCVRLSWLFPAGGLVHVTRVGSGGVPPDKSYLSTRQVSLQLQDREAGGSGRGCPGPRSGSSVTSSVTLCKPPNAVSQLRNRDTF